jgi:orotate phosphoribosyltransferase
VEPPRDRFERLLVRSSVAMAERTVDVRKYDALRDLDNEDVLLVDDTWTTGGSVQSAAGALKAAGAGVVGALVIGRHVHQDFRDNADRLEQLPNTFDWDTCALCAEG